MSNNNLDYRWMKLKNEKSYFAIVRLKIEKTSVKNEIIENYSGEGYSNQAINVGVVGMETWKEGLVKGLEFALLYSPDFWKITIDGLYGKPITDTNPTIIGYTGILAFLASTQVVIDKVNLEKLESYVYESWDDGNLDKIPNFDKLIFG